MKKVARYDSNRVRLKTGEYQRSDKGYEYRYTLYGKQFSIYDRTLEGLREKEREMEEEKQSMEKRFNSRTTTLNDVYSLWRELKRGVRDNTYSNYCYLYDAYVKDSIGNAYIASLKKSDIKRFFNHLADERRLKIGTIDGVHTVLHQVFQLAADDEWISSNPADGAIKELMRARNIHREKRQALTKQEQKLLLRFLSGNNPNARWRPITVILLETGMRVGEATGLRWCDLDFENGLIHVDHTLVYYDSRKNGCRFAINDTKTPASKRVIPMTSAARKAFLEEREMQKALGVHCEDSIDGYTDFIFLNRFGHVHHQGTLNKAYKRIIRDCNDAEFLRDNNPKVLLPNFSCHNLRHTFATRLCESGMNMKVAQEILGHADISTTMDLYVTVTKEMRDKAMCLLETFIADQ